MRPIYETEDYHKAERKVIDKICHGWRCDAVKLPIKYALDYALVREGNVIAWAEVKIRESYTFDQLDKMGGYMLALAKWQMANSLTAVSKKPFVLVVKAGDEVRAASYQELPTFDAAISGRTTKSRGDWQDIEPCIFIPIDEFQWRF